jgi:hypothetical protein
MSGYVDGNSIQEVVMRITSFVIVIWLVIGAVAATQRDYFKGSGHNNCRKTSDTVLTVVAGPLNYLGVNPKVKCKLPQPSQ